MLEALASEVELFVLGVELSTLVAEVLDIVQASLGLDTVIGSWERRESGSFCFNYLHIPQVQHPPL